MTIHVCHPSHRLTKGRAHDVFITAPDEDAARAFEADLFLALETRHGDIRRVVASAITHGIDWPNWWPHYREAVAAYRAALQRPPMAEMPWLTDTERRLESWQRYQLCCRLGLFAIEQVGLPAYFEVEHFVKAGDIHPALAWMEPSRRGEYVKNCFPRHRLVDLGRRAEGSAGLWHDYGAELLAHGFVTLGGDRPLGVAAAGIPPGDLLVISRQYGVPVLAGHHENVDALLAAARTDPGLAGAIHRHKSVAGLACVMSPPGISWQQLQAYRWQVRGMVGTMVYFLEEAEDFAAYHPGVFESLVAR